MSIRAQGQGYMVHVKRKIGDKRHEYRKVVPSMQEAKELEAEVILAFTKGQPNLLKDAQRRSKSKASAEAPVTLGQLFDRLFDILWGAKRSQVKTQFYTFQKKHVIACLGEDALLSDVSKEWFSRLVAYGRDRGLADSTIEKYQSCLHHILKEAYDHRWVSFVPRMYKLDGTKKGKRTRWLDFEEEKQLFEKGREDKPTYIDFYEFLIDTGLRLSEALSLQREDWIPDERYGEIVVFGEDGRTKNDKIRRVPLTRRAHDIFMKYANNKKRSERVFTQSKRGLQEYIKTLRAFSGLPEAEKISMHSLRHSFCSRLATMGETLQTIKELAGHDSIETTLIYAHLAPSTTKESISRLDERIQEQRTGAFRSNGQEQNAPQIAPREEHLEQRA